MDISWILSGYLEIIKVIFRLIKVIFMIFLRVFFTGLA